ncbi:hypothetical protein PSEUDO8O_30745 [Pseudomonas sp. 8O]|nr:hypothetical protein PSEUDO8O_30745 [Pseudomonas sp. 8O]
MFLWRHKNNTLKSCNYFLAPKKQQI